MQRAFQKKTAHRIKGRSEAGAKFADTPVALAWFEFVERFQGSDETCDSHRATASRGAPDRMPDFRYLTPVFCFHRRIETLDEIDHIGPEGIDHLRDKLW